MKIYQYYDKKKDKIRTMISIKLKNKLLIFDKFRIYIYNSD